MWGDAYDGSDELRPKYGCLNLADDPDGDYQATDYGASYFVLKNTLRWRCAITDSFDEDAVEGSLRQCSAMLSQLGDDDLLAAAEHAGAPGVGNAFHSYKETQIHGSVRFAEDVHRIVAFGCSADVRHKIERFAMNNGIQLEWRKMGMRFTKKPSNT